MRPLTAFVPVAVAVAAVAMVPTVATASTGHAGRAHAAGDSGPPPVLPTAVRVRINRGETALSRAADYVDRDMPDKATASLKNARRNMYAAWRAATYIVDNAPPPAPPVDDKAQATGAAPGAGGTTFTSPNATAVAVLDYQHDVVGAAFGLIDGAKGTLRDQVSITLFAALDRRDSAITYIHNQPVPPPPPADKAFAAGAPVAGGDTFATLMPGIVPDLDDEILQSRDLSKGGALTSGEKRIVLLARDQIDDTETTVNAFWPPLPAGD